MRALGGASVPLADSDLNKHRCGKNFPPPGTNYPKSGVEFDAFMELEASPGATLTSGSTPIQHSSECGYGASTCHTL